MSNKPIILSIVIPAYNEEKTILEIIRRAQKVDLKGIEKEIIVIDNNSDDGTYEKVKNFLKKENNGNIKIFQELKRGKGAALKKGLGAAGGDITLVQDADLEYNPRDYPWLLKPILEGKADAVYGSRFMENRPERAPYFWHLLGNKFLTFLSNFFSGLELTDMETGYKAFKKEVLDSFKEKLKSKKFGIEPEITAYLAEKRWRVREVAISYSPRSGKQGKKIKWKDGLAAIWHIVRFNVFS